MLKVRLAATLLVAASLSGCAAQETDRTTMAASADNSRLNPLGQANMEMKTPCCQGVNAPLRPGGSCDALDSEGC